MPSVNPGPASTGQQPNAQAGDWRLTGLLYESNIDNLTAFPGGGQTNALQLTSEMNRITTVATAGDSVRLPSTVAVLPNGGLTVFIVNHGANPMQVYGFGTDTIDDQATTSGVSQMPNSSVLYICHTAGAWYTNGLSTGFAKTLGLQTLSYAVVAANTTDAQANGTPITALVNHVTATSNPGSVTLPASSPGLQIMIACATAADAISVYPNAGGTGTETINALSANAKYTMAALTSTTFICAVAGQWFTVPRVAS